MKQHYDCIVLGTGGVGSAACWQLSQRGAAVLGLDRFPPGHDRGSSHGQTRIIRQAYFEHADYVPLLLRAYELWAELEQTVGQQLFEQVGLLQIGPDDGAVISGVLHAAALHQLPVETLSAAESNRRFPGFHVPEALTAVFEPRAGLLHVEACVRAHCLAAMTAGAELLSGVTVHGWDAKPGAVTVHTNQGDFHAARLIVTAGAWSPELLGCPQLSLRVLRKHLYWFAAPRPEHQASAGAPTFLYDLPHGCFYGLPSINADGLKCGEHSGGERVADPLSDPRLADERDQQRVTEFVRDFLPGVAPQFHSRSVCFYTMSPDEHFIVDRHPEHANVCFAAGLSGHGFKFTGVLGQVLADWTLSGATSLPVDFLSASRQALRSR
ncbi:N-methyl-L-tryptophan oxidase [Anatilimnocola floriformis]|uniref:N-methyl-L-tryptophan oxidase n=1 Tax=Anatilimnocola floriformis TaxID=2948575 RepID=UPI0020C3311F|nr:N-methyl-L-tryptophan oxidase [Anatilimnocola floriformis]